MIHRYTKAMKRRALWDREPASNSPWKRGGTNWEREISSTHSRSAKVEEPESKSGAKQSPEQVLHKDFESFKRAVDYAMARDPVGTLFGRRLRSPISSNNSSWTSWAWIFDPKDIKEPVAEDQEKPVEPEKNKTPASGSTSTVSESSSYPSVAHTSTSSKTTTSVQSSRSILFRNRSSITTEYVYDPISGRKVVKASASETPITPAETPKKIKETSNPKKEAPKDFITTMFGEHGVDIPVKTYIPHKVYGYGGENQNSKVKTDVSKMSFETSRKREYDSLRWRTLGNNLDATNFNCEPWNNRDADVFQPAQPDVIEPAEKKIRTSPAPAEDTPLFSGTTYQDKPMLEPKHDWLASEGFRAKQGMTMAGLKDKPPLATANTLPIEKLEPAIDRPASQSTEIPVKKFGSGLQPAIDRVGLPAKSAATVSPWKNFGDILARDAKRTQDQREDIDLLRPSDVRAATKSARVTKQEVEDKKVKERGDLDKNYDALAQAEQNPVGVADRPFSSKTTLGTDLGHVWKHIENHPTGIVAKTMQSLGLTKMKQEPTKITSYTAKKDSVVPRSTATIEAVNQSYVQLQNLGKDLKAVYEEERGEIANEIKVHKQDLPASGPRFTQPTIRPGVVRDLEIERHTQEFEPKFAELVDGAKQIRREILEMNQTLESLKRNATKREQQSAIAPSDSVSLLDGISPYILLKYNKDGDIVTPISYQSAEKVSEYTSMLPSKNIVSTLSQLPNPSSFVQWFGDLDKMGYALSQHNADSLLFHKPNTAQKVGQRLRNRIAAQEAAAQPVPREAANVLDEIPTTVPPPGPAAPTAPATSASQQPFVSESQVPEEAHAKPRRKPRNNTRMTRQEPVFSGQQRLKPQTTALPDPEHFQKQNPPTSSFTRARQQEYEQADEPQIGYFKRFTRFVRRIILTGIAFGAGAYGIGVIAEGLQGRAQIAAGENGGPMKRLVLEDKDRVSKERQRNGIFSTESSR